jgi:hypothetical protein
MPCKYASIRAWCDLTWSYSMMWSYSIILMDLTWWLYASNRPRACPKVVLASRYSGVWLYHANSPSCSGTSEIKKCCSISETSILMMWYAEQGRRIGCGLFAEKRSKGLVDGGGLRWPMCYWTSSSSGFGHRHNASSVGPCVRHSCPCTSRRSSERGGWIPANMWRYLFLVLDGVAKV